MEELQKFIDDRIRLHQETLDNSKYSSPVLKDEARARISELNLIHKKLKEMADNNIENSEKSEQQNLIEKMRFRAYFGIFNSKTDDLARKHVDSVNHQNTMHSERQQGNYDGYVAGYNEAVNTLENQLRNLTVNQITDLF